MDEKHLFNRLSQEVAKHPWHDVIQERRSKDFQEPDVKCVMNCEKFMECGGLKKKDCEFWDKVAEELKPTIKRALEETFEPTKCMNEFVKEKKWINYYITVQIAVLRLLLMVTVSTVKQKYDMLTM